MTKPTEPKHLLAHTLGERVALYAMVKTSEVRIAKNNNPFLILSFVDKSGEMKAKPIFDVPDNAHELYPAGSIVALTGIITEFNGLQLAIDTITVITDDRPENDKSLYIQLAPMAEGDMMVYFKTKLAEIDDPAIQTIVKEILNKYFTHLFSHAAAKQNHHAYFGGLAFHTISMLKLAETMYGFYPGLNKSLLYGAIMVHDICKIEEMTPVEDGSTYTKKGKLIGHITMAETEIVRAAMKHGIDMDSEMVLLLRHVVLSHHGKQEWGSPVFPQTPEAVVVHSIDMLDARTSTALQAVENLEEGGFSPRIYSLEKQEIYKLIPTEPVVAPIEGDGEPAPKSDPN